MLRIIQNTSAGGAKSYYSTADYYSEGQELQGQWRGLGSDRLGLSGEVRKEQWDALCDNRDPSTGQVLTPRQKDNRRIGYDFNFHVPKSVSLLYALSKDERIVDAFRQCVSETMDDMQAEMKTRVRKEGNNDDRATGNMVWGEFVHFTSRPVDGVPDPHLHAHCFVFNSTFDPQEQRWKAGQFSGLKRDAPYFEAVFHSRLARRLADLGIASERTQTGWEIAGLSSKATLDKFSRRTAQIEEKAREQGITDPEQKSELGARTRGRKTKDLSFEQLRQEWKSRLNEDELAQVARIKDQIGGPGISEDPQVAERSVNFATDHCFERKSVVPERELLREALKYSVGRVSPQTITTELRKRDLVFGDRDGRRFMTTRAVLEEEGRMIDFARRGRGTRATLGTALSPHVFHRDWLNEGQRRAVLHVLGSRDRVILIRGAAGVGKTSMMQEAVEAIEAYGNKVFAFAPSANASRGVLRNEGFENAETVARLLVDPNLQDQVKGQVLWIDEAGLLGTKTMAQLFDLAEKFDARVILSGDRRQHGSVERGAALRLLETEAGLVSAEIKEIQRQKGAYRQAVGALSEGRTEDGFAQLDQLGWLREVNEADRYKTLANDYIATVAAGKSALVVSPTHFEGERITSHIRAELQAKGQLGKNERQFTILENADLTQAQRGQAGSYTPGDVLIFHQNAKGFKRGQRVGVDGPIDSLPLDQAARFQVFHPSTVSLAAGDLIRITKNGATADGAHQLNNGSIYRVKEFTAEGNIVLNNGWTVAKEFGHLAHGYVVTSHASQGKTVDRVFIGQSGASFGASSQEQFYVSVSRAREQAVVYTHCKADLLEAVRRSDDRLTATEFVTGRDHRARAIVLGQAQELIAVGYDRPFTDHQRQEMRHER